jgi:hypothetical protein
MTDAVALGLFGLVLLVAYLLLRWRTVRTRPKRGHFRTVAPRRHRASRPKRPLAVVDGSNVMHWRDNTPQVGPVVEVMDQLDRRGFDAGVIFDANAGYKLTGRYVHDGLFGAMLGVNAERVLVVPKGTQADPFLLTHASDTGAIVISNDRFRDRIADYPALDQPGRLVRGGWRDGKVWLDLPD